MQVRQGCPSRTKDSQPSRVRAVVRGMTHRHPSAGCVCDVGAFAEPSELASGKPRVTLEGLMSLAAAVNPREALAHPDTYGDRIIALFNKCVAGENDRGDDRLDVDTPSERAVTLAQVLAVASRCVRTASVAVHG